MHVSRCVCAVSRHWDSLYLCVSRGLIIWRWRGRSLTELCSTSMCVKKAKKTCSVSAAVCGLPMRYVYITAHDTCLLCTTDLARLWPPWFSLPANNSLYLMSNGHQASAIYAPKTVWFPRRLCVIDSVSWRLHELLVHWKLLSLWHVTVTSSDYFPYG